MTRVVVVDDHPIVRSGLAALLSSDPAFEVAATAGSVAGALQVADATDEASAPDLAVVDLRLPDGDGVDLALALRRRWPGLRVLILTMHADEESVIRALAAGLHGYVLKDADPETILAAARQVASGVMVIGSGADAGVRAAASVARPLPTGSIGALNAREREILDLLAAGLPTGQVAHRLYVAPKTVRNRLTEIFRKLDVTSREEAIRLARAAGLGRGAG